MDYEKDVSIDPKSLDLECLKQPNLTLKYGNYKAETDKVLKQLDEKYKVLKAQIATKVRENPAAYGATKLTVAITEDIVAQQPEIQKIKEELVDAAYEADLAKIAYYAVQDKKESLNILVKLLTADYFKGPDMTLTLSERLEQKTKDVDKKVKITQPKRKVKKNKKVILRRNEK